MTRIHITDKQIRQYLGHNGVECRVRIKRNGMIYRHGSPDPADRSKDFCIELGCKSDCIFEMRQNMARVGA